MCLSDELLNIIVKYNINDIYPYEDRYISGNEVYNLLIKELVHFIEGMNKEQVYTVRGAGVGAKEFIPMLLKKGMKIDYITCPKQGITEKAICDIQVISVEEWKSQNSKNPVIITAYSHHDEIAWELNAEGYEVIDPFGNLLETYPCFESPYFEYKWNDNYLRLSYQEINALELLYKETKRVEVLKQLIFALFCKKDFLFAEKYSEEFKKLGMMEEYKRYHGALAEMNTALLAVVKREYQDCFLINVVDSLSGSVVKKMKWLSGYMEKGIELTGLIAELPYTHYSLNSLFTGRNPFEIEKRENINRSDSELLRYLDQQGYSINIASSVKKTMSMSQWINANKCDYPYMSLSEALFEGLCLLEKNNNRNFVFIHSVGEIHSPFNCVGYEKKLMAMQSFTSSADMENQMQGGYHYTDMELQWYYQLFDKANIPIATMGDHGVSLENEVNYFLGDLKDYPRHTFEMVEQAFCVNNVGKNGKIHGLISNRSLNKILLDLLCTHDCDWDCYVQKSVELRQVPGYAEAYCTKFMSKGMFAYYEGGVGIRTENEILMKYVSGRKVYLLNGDVHFVNHASEEKYQDRISRLEALLPDLPFELYFLKQFETHKRILEELQYDEFIRLKKELERVKSEQKLCLVNHIQNLDLEITERCSLKCRNCFNQIQKYKNPQDIPLDRIYHSVDILLQYVDGIEEMRVLGGEPFMNRHIAEVVEYCCQKEKIGRVQIYTNATIMPTKEQLTTFQNKKISFYISDYHNPKQKVDQMVRLLDEYKIPYRVYALGFWYNPGEIADNNKNVEQLIHTYKSCRGKDCITLLDGKLFQCELAANANRLGIIPDSKRDYVDLFEEDDLKVRIHDYLYETEYLDACKYCNLTSQKVIPGEQI